MFELEGKKKSIVFVVILLVCFAVGMLVGHLVTPTAPAQEISTSERISSSNCHDHDDGADHGHTHDHDHDHGADHPHMEVEEDTNAPYAVMEEDKWMKEKYMIPDILNRIDPKNLKENLRYLTEKPHLATTPRDDELATYIRDKFEEAGFDSSKLVPYNVYLSRPNVTDPNKITMHQNGQKIFESKHKEKTIHPDDADPNFVDAFNAFTPAGTVSTEPGVGVVYVNYGRYEDFEKLEELGINITGHIVIARYGKIYRGNKINHAAIFGAIGIIIYSDPEDVAPEGVRPEDVYDNSFWLPGSGVQRGSTYLGDGDPLTPAWPSTEHAYRLTEEEADLAKIPTQPIGYDDAREIMRRLDGENAPSDWQGGFAGLTYKLGPFFNSQNGDVSLTLSTHNYGKIMRSYNVIGIIKGSVEPDRYVMIGNHRDAWGYGASDPSSGTAQLLETARVYGTLLKEGWRPRRTLIFCSWGAEEYGLIGSTEWVEENIDKLQSRAVGYLNTDTCTTGPILRVSASPLMQDMFLTVTKLIPGVEDSAKTLFDEWKAYGEGLKPNAPEKPIIGNLGSGSDHAPFTFYGGIPAADIGMKIDKIKYNVTSYPYYHTGYETFYMVSTFIDPEFKSTQACGRLATLILKYLADSSILPYNIRRFPIKLSENLKKSKNRDKLMEIYDKYIELENAVQRFDDTTRDFERKLKEIKYMTPLQLRGINDQLMKLEQIFILPEGLIGRPAVRNAVFANSQFDTYASDGYPGLSDLLHKYDELLGDEKITRDKQIKRHISDLTIMTDRASSFLEETFLV